MGQTDLDTGGQGLSSGSFTSLGGTLERLHSHLHVHIKDVLITNNFLLTKDTIAITYNALVT